MENLKTPIFVILFFFACLFILPKVFGPIPFTVQNVTSGKPDVFRVEGSGEASAIPDTAIITIGMTSENRSLVAAQKQTNTVMNTLTSALKKLGVTEADIKTINYSVYPNLIENAQPLPFPQTTLDQSISSDTVIGTEMSEKAFPSTAPSVKMPLPPGATPRSYTVSHTVEVKVTAIDNINQIIDVSTQAGANQIGDIRFTFDDEQKKRLEEKAREDAIKQAKEKAESLAKAAGLSIGKIVDIQSYPDYGSGAYGRDTAAMSKYGTTEINPGEGTIRVNVSLAYEIR